MPEISIRPAVLSDLESLVDLETRAMHFPMGHRVREWFRDDYPGIHRDWFAVAESEGTIVSVAALLPQTITYRGIPLNAGMWEAVVTEESYRRQGLCRRLFETLEARFEADVLLVQGLTWLYRRFGYHPALKSHGGWDSSGRTVDRADFSPSPLEIRPASEEDAPFLASLQQASASRYIIVSPAEEARWRYALRPDRTVAGPGETGLNRWLEWQILSQEGRAVGAFAHDPWDLAMLTQLEIVPGAATWRDAGAAAIYGTAAFSNAARVRITLPDNHPLFQAYPRAFERSFRGYGDWAARIPDAVRFLTKAAPALEACLAGSALVGWTGEISLSRVVDGLTLRFESGRFAGAEPWGGERADHARVRLSPGGFEALVLGYRSIRDILSQDPDCAADEEAEAVLAALFPSGSSFFRPL